jgi:hypothetical protein
MNANCNSHNCPVCGGAMRAVGIVPIKFSRVSRFKCTCGHVEDLKVSSSSSSLMKDESAMPEGIQDNLSELSLPT